MDISDTCRIDKLQRLMTGYQQAQPICVDGRFLMIVCGTSGASKDDLRTAIDDVREAE